MSDFPLIAPLLEQMTLDDAAPPQSGSCVFRVRHQASGAYGMVKRISIPASASDTAALILTGAVADEEAARQYYAALVDSLRSELSQFRTLAQSPCICSYGRFQVAEKQQTPGYDLYLLAPYRTSLKAYLQQNAISKKRALALGLDLCEALCTIRASGAIYVNLKPENVFLENGRFCIGDFGLIPLQDLSHAQLPAHYVGRFTPPELCAVSGTVNETADIYSAGMLLYYIFNGNHLPFEEADTTDKAADARRIAGEALPTPLYADYEIDAIIRKACAHNPADRYQTPQQLQKELQDYCSRNALGDESLVPPLVADDPPLTPETEQAQQPEPVQHADVSALSHDFKENFAPTQEAPAKKKKKRKLWIPILLAALLLLGAGGFYFYFYASAIQVTDLSLEARTPESLTIQVQASDQAHLLITCSAQDGSYTSTCRSAEQVTFSDLTGGSVYDITVSSEDWHHVSGSKNFTTTTSGWTEILNFEAQEQDNGVLVSFQVSGPEPEQWTLRCTRQSAESVSYPVEGRSIRLEDLLPNTPYTLSLEAGDGYFLTGTTQISYSYTRSITASNLVVSDMTPQSLTVCWDSDSDLATQWSAVCTGESGYSETVTTEQCQATFENLTPGESYTIAVSNQAMSMPLLLTVKITVLDITRFDAAPTEQGTLQLSWETADQAAPNLWVLTYGPTGSTQQTVLELSSAEAELTDLAPNTAYTFSLSGNDGELLTGTSSLDYQTPDNGTYDGFDFGGIFIGLYEKTRQDWAVATLGQPKESFAPGQAMICVIEPTTLPSQRSTDEAVQTMLVIRDANGIPLAVSQKDTTWNRMWSANVYAMDIDDVPQEPGEYRIELYLNRQLLRSASFTIESGASGEPSA